MGRYRVGVFLGMLIILGVPLVGPWLGMLGLGFPPLESQELTRLAGLAGTTILLVLGACLLAVPTGSLFAFWLERGPLNDRLRQILRYFLLVAMFIPLPVTMVSWQIILGNWLPPLSLAPGQVAWRPWAQGLLPAIILHALSGMPWVAWFVSQSLRLTDRGLEEDALVSGGPGYALRHVLWPRVRPALGIGALWVSVQAITEITVTDALMVRTLAEEVYTQFLLGDRGILAVAVRVILPWGILFLIAFMVARKLWPTVRLFLGTGQPSRPWSWSPHLRTVGNLVMMVTLIGFFGLPLLALFWKAGGGSTPAGWRVSSFHVQLRSVLATESGTLGSSLITAALTGLITTALAALAASISRHAPRLRASLVLLALFLWITPGPVVGWSLHESILQLVGIEDSLFRHLGVSVPFPPVRSILYDQPSAIPVIWSAMIRFFPLALALMMVATLTIPRSLDEAAILDGMSTLGVWRTVVWPTLRSPALATVLAVMALSLGEVSAAKMVNPPFHSLFVLRLFDQMHYGAESTVAAMAIIQISVAILLAMVMKRNLLPFTSPAR